MGREVSIAVVGLGEFGRRYVGALDALSDVRIAWGIDRNDANRAAVDAGRLAARTSADLSDALADDDVTAIVVVTPESAHREIAVAALEAGKHVLVEKPLATDEADGLAMIEAAELSGCLLLPAFLLRFDYRYAQLHQRLADVGPVRSAYAYRNFDRSLFELYSRTHSFVENAIHDLDLLLWYVGSEVTDVHGFCRTTLGLANPDVNWGVLEFANGAVATVQTTWLYPPQEHRNLQWNAGIQLMCERGVLEASNDQRGLMANVENDGILLLDQTGWSDIAGEPRGAFGAMLRHAVACFRGDATWLGTAPREALESMRIARRLIDDAAARSVPGT